MALFFFSNFHFQLGRVKTNVFSFKKMSADLDQILHCFGIKYFSLLDRSCLVQLNQP